MNDQHTFHQIERALESGAGVLRMAPTWVPRGFSVPGKRLRLHPQDLYPLGAHRGGICERWLASTTRADNGPLTTPDEGLSYIEVGEGRVTFKDALRLQGPALIGQVALDAGGWVVLNKLFDYEFPLPFHMHQDDTYAAHTGQLGKPEAYYFPPQYNPTRGIFPYTFFGLEPGTTKDQVIDCLKRWNEGDNGILALSKAYKLELGTGWDVPPGILHAPGSLVTYEPQRASDVFSMWQSLVADYVLIDRSMLVRNVPQDKWEDYNYLIGMLDWDANVAPEFKKQHFTPPKPAYPVDAMQADGYRENWITYGSPYFSAKELTVEPGRAVTLREPVAYGALCVQGVGRMGLYSAAAPGLIRYGQMTQDEFFVSVGAARDGVTVTNLSDREPLVFMKYFNAGHPDMPVRA